MKTVRREFTEFKRAVKAVADACGVTEEQLQALFHHLKYSGGVLSKEDSDRCINALKK